jgi:hypothetical protein
MRVARHQDDALALQTLCLVDGANRLFWGLRARIRSAMRDLRQAGLGRLEVAYADRVPELFRAVDVGTAEASARFLQLPKSAEGLTDATRFCRETSRYIPAAPP